MLREYKTNNQTLNNEKNTFKERNEKLEDMIENLKTKYESKNEVIRHQHEKVTLYQNRLVDAEKKLENNNVINKQLNSKIDHLESEKNVINDEIKFLKKELEKESKYNEDRVEDLNSKEIERKTLEIERKFDIEKSRIEQK